MRFDGEAFCGARPVTGIDAFQLGEGNRTALRGDYETMGVIEWMA